MLTTPTNDELLQDFLDSPQADKLRLEREEKRLNQRRNLVTELAEVTEGLKANYPKMVAAEERLAEQIRRAEESLEALRRGYGTGEERETRNRLSNRQTLLEGELLQTAPEAINVFIKGVGDEWEAVRARGIDFNPGRRHPITGALEPGSSNAQAVNARMGCLREAQRQAESLKFAALTSEELRKRLDALRAAIPAVEA